MRGIKFVANLIGKSPKVVKNRASKMGISITHSKGNFDKATPSEVNRFWDNVERNGNCWEWKGAHSKKGYGRFRRGNILYSPHRAIVERYIGPIPDGLFSCHKCNNPRCVRPSHLYIGTRSENMKDGIRAGTVKVPTNGGFKPGHNGKITPQQVREIRNQYSKGELTQRELGNRYGLTNWAVNKITQRKTWRHVE